MKISTSVLDRLSYIYISIPMFIFLIFWLKPMFAILSVIVLFFILKKIFNKLSNCSFAVSKKTLIFILVSAIIWCICAGIGNLSYQSPDWHTRNAIFRDLINFSYPVKYDNGTTLVYYIGMFLPGSLFAKLFLPFGENFAFKIGNYFTLFYVVLGIYLITLQLIRITKATKKQQFLVLIMFVFFSGIDLFGGELLPNLVSMHLERHQILQYSCNTTLLFWVYNQTIAPWVITALFFKNPYKIENFGFLAGCCLFYSPLAFCGICLYFGMVTFIYFIKSFKKNRQRTFIKKLFSKTNILSLFLILIFYLYFKSNATVASDGFDFILLDFYQKLKATNNMLEITIIFFKSFGIFILLEAGVYLIPLFQKYRKNLIFQITTLLLCTIPFFQYAGCADFCMRASIPSLFILMIFVIKYLFQSGNNYTKTFLIVVFLIGSLTPVMEFFRGFMHNTFADKNTLIKDNIKTYNNKITQENCKYEISSGDDVLVNIENHCNYGSLNPKEHIYYKYLSK